MKKKRNPLFWFGFLGIIGVLGLFAFSVTTISFLLFFFFFTYRNMTPDELFWQNVRRAGLRAFVAGTGFGLLWMLAVQCRGVIMQMQGSLFATMGDSQAALAAAIASGKITLPMGVYSQFVLAINGFVWTLLVSLGTFVFTLMYFNRKEKKFAREDNAC